MLHCRQTGTVNIHPRFVLQFVCLSVCQFKIGHGESNCRIRMKNAARVILLTPLSWHCPDFPPSPSQRLACGENVRETISAVLGTAPNTRPAATMQLNINCIIVFVINIVSLVLYYYIPVWKVSFTSERKVLKVSNYNLMS